MAYTRHLLATVMQNVKGRGENPLVAVYFTREGGSGVVPGGIVAYDRGIGMDDEHTYVTHSFDLMDDNRIALNQGHYDLTLGEALRDAAERADRELGAYVR